MHIYRTVRMITLRWRIVETNIKCQKLKIFILYLSALLIHSPPQLTSLPNYPSFMFSVIVSMEVKVSEQIVLKLNFLYLATVYAKQ